MMTPEDRKPVFLGRPVNVRHSPFYDYELCETQQDLQRVIKHINHYHYDLITVTQDLGGRYTVFFRRPEP